MSFEEEFDKIIRQKTEGAEFPFEEANWERMSGALDADRRGAKLLGNKKYYLAGLMLLILSASAVFLFDDLSKFSSKNKNTAHDVPVVLNETSDILLIKSDKIAPKASNSEIKRTNVKVAKSVAAVLSNETTNSNQFNEVSKAEVTLSFKRLSNKHNGGIFNGAKSGRKDLLVSKHSDTETAPPNQITKADEPNVLTTVPLSQDNLQQQASTKETSAQQLQVASDNADILDFEPLLAIITSLPKTINEKEIRLKNLYLPKYLDEDYYKVKNTKKHYLNIEAGTTYLNGWDVLNGKDGRGFNGFAGINYGIYLNNDFSINSGVQFYNISNIQMPFYGFTKTEYGFGATSSNTVITSNVLYFIAVPVKFSFLLDRHNQIGLGANIGFLTKAKNNIETFLISEYGKTNVVNEKKITAYSDMASTNILLSAFYQTKLNKRLALNAEVLYGLTDLFKNNGKFTNKENALGLRLSLQYTLFDK